MCSCMASYAATIRSTPCCRLAASDAPSPRVVSTCLLFSLSCSGSCGTSNGLYHASFKDQTSYTVASVSAAGDGA